MKKMSVLSLSIVLLLAGCGGGGSNNEAHNNSGSDNNSGVDQPQKPDHSENLTLLKQVRLADVASEITAKTFQLESWNPRAMAIHNDVLYIADSNKQSKLLRYNLKTKQVLPAVDPEQAIGLEKAWDELKDIHITNDRLYVASFASNRVDVFDLAGGDPQFLMSLGTGTWSGDQQNYAIVHTHAVTANDQFVFAPDIQGRINVWSQDDVTRTNHLKAIKYARLSLPGCERYCDVRIEAVGDQLYAALADGKTFVYDLKNLKRGDSEVVAIKQQAGLANVYYRATDGLFYASRLNGQIETYKPESLLSDASPLPPEVIDSIGQYRVQGQENIQSLSKATDLTVYNDNVLTLGNGKITVIPLRTLQQKRSTSLANTVQLSQAQAVKHERVLQDGESWETLTNKQLRHVQMNQILSAQLEANTIRLQSYSAIPVSNLEIHARLKNTDQWIVLAKLDQLDAFSTVSLKLNINDQSRFQLLDGSGTIALDGLSNFTEFPVDLFDFKIYSSTDMHVQKLASIQPVWNIYFGTYDQNTDSKWRRINPLYAREWVIMMTNFAYMLSTPEFKTLWFNHKAVMGHDFFGNGGQVIGENGFFTEEDYQKVYQQMMNRSEINLGITNMGGGLGGGAVLGVDTWIYYGHYRLSGYGLIAHEFGHHWGSHNSAWANDGYGFQPMMSWLHFYFQRQQGSLPYMDPNVNKFHLAPADQLYASISSNIVNGKPGTAPINKVDQYFAQHPVIKN